MYHIWNFPPFLLWSFLNALVAHPPVKEKKQKGFPEKGLKDFPLSLFVLFPVLQGKVAPARVGALSTGLAGEKATECCAGVQHSRSLRSSPGMETDEKTERCGKKGVVKIVVLHFRGWAARTDLQHPALSSLHLIQAKVPMQSAWKMWQFYALLTQSQMTAQSWNNKKAPCISRVQGWQILPDVSVEHSNTQHLICFPLRLAAHVLEVSG